MASTKWTPTEMTREVLRHLTAQVSGQVNAAYQHPDVDTEALADALGGGENLLLIEAFRRAALVRLVDRALNEMPPGTELRPVMEEIGLLLGVEAIDWDEGNH